MVATKNTDKIRYAVIGLGHIAQVAVLPAFAHTARNSVLTALVSDDPEKLRQLSRRYGVKLTYSYEQYDDVCGVVILTRCISRCPQYARGIFHSGGERRRACSV
jgi:hypothetical protein